ncbi:restriction endonuclease subunit M [Candidatus Shapirobacteria bacterium CG03_land_8_20_14_0_80_40_19]|uniref:Restriction endonuclease subunit M n=2 Tax=Candidatus Shapironibacteriota TaxID=1752721 RepID=A0A2M7BG53_9BACT|nr:MAG: restriction endonuclease subunit M [Candidatus Shapirobacteria bacterium CG03_land_8_20_14_0_80_40_19]
MNDLLTISQASEWASQYLNKTISSSNISYLIQYGKIKKIGSNGSTCVNKNDLIAYYQSFFGRRETSWKQKLGEDLNWHLSFDQLREKDTTKHVHRLHPYKGKFIPQLVEYFLDEKIDEFKKEIYFRKGDIVLDPFCGSGTTLVQASELGIHAVGIDVSAFNAFISNVKVGKYNLNNLTEEIQEITKLLKTLVEGSGIAVFDFKLAEELKKFNDKYFPVPEYKYKLSNHQINEAQYSIKYEEEFKNHYYQLINEFQIELKQSQKESFLDKWYLKNIREEIEFVFNLIKKIQNIETKKALGIILSRTIRSCRATTHSDLATLKEPVTAPYYCQKHGKICKPLFSIFGWWERYGNDTVFRLAEFNRLRTDTFQYCLSGDSRMIDIFGALEKKNSQFAKLAKQKKIKGIFSSPPYVGLIDYHQQHAYAYDLLGFKRNDELEIGPLFKGQGVEARKTYIEGISQVLINCRKFLVDDFDIFLVANDKYNLYPTIAEKSNLKIVKQFKRPVLNRTERDKGAYSEIIFHLKIKG